MTATQQFIEDAIKGGWRNLAPICFDVVAMEPFIPDFIDGNQITLQVILLDPLAWIAVGKARGWDGKQNCNNCGDPWEKACWCDRYALHAVDRYRHYMHRFIDHLADGDTIEEALSKLL